MVSDEAKPATRRPYAVGTLVEIRTQFDRSWNAGFVIAAVEDDRYRVRRESDATELPVTFDRQDVRRRRKNNLWWV